MPTIYSDATRAVRAQRRARGDDPHAPCARAGSRRRSSPRAASATFEQAEGVLARGEADLVASARQTLADPDWFLKIRELGRGAEVRRCEFTNYCEALDQQHKQVTCKLWDREELDAPDVTLAAGRQAPARRAALAPLACERVLPCVDRCGSTRSSSALLAAAAAAASCRRRPAC